MDPVTTPLLTMVLGTLAREVVTEASKGYLTDKLKALFGRVEDLGSGNTVERAYQEALEQAYRLCLEMLLRNIQSFGYTDAELHTYRDSLKAFIKDEDVAAHLLEAVRDPHNALLPDPDVLRKRWDAVGGAALPDTTLWTTVARAFRRHVMRQAILSDQLRAVLNAQTQQEVKGLLERQVGVRVPVSRDSYAQRMRTRFAPVDLANLMPALADDPGRMEIHDVFVPQYVRENPPPIELPKDLATRLSIADTSDAVRNEYYFERFQSYINQSPTSILDIIATKHDRLLVFIGDPGSGKSTLLRYLLTGIISPPIDQQTSEPLSWTVAFRNAFPLLIELRDFYAQRQRNECDTFLEYVAYMGKTAQWFLDDHAVHDSLETGPALVMFDGLDEIFDSADRERVTHEIAGFAQRYPSTRIIVTSRPVGYREQILRNAGFAHFGIQDLNDTQIETFIRGWFALTFPQQPHQAEQRIKRVLGSVRQSQSIRLLAGNPMLLTIMALLAREQELPRERVTFYEKAVEVLCHHWDANKHLHIPQEDYLDIDDKKALLRRIAIHMQTGVNGLLGNLIQHDDLEHVIQEYLVDVQLQPNVAEAKQAARRMIGQLRERNYILCLRGPHLYGFVHRTFLEYLSAAEYVRRFDRQPQQMSFEELLQLFDQYCDDDDWHEVLRLICGQIHAQFVGQIVEHLVNQIDLEQWSGTIPPPELYLAIWCLGEVRNLTKLNRAGDALLTVLIALFQANNFNIEPIHFRRLFRTIHRIGDKWPGQRDMLCKVILPPTENPAYVSWPSLVAMIVKKHPAIEALVVSAQWPIRWGAIPVLAEYWPNEGTRALITQRCMQDTHGTPRGIAFQTLAKQWPDETTRTLLLERAVQDEDEDIRHIVLQTLAKQWPDETTRTLLLERAVQDEDKGVRRIILETLAEQWPNETTRTLLLERAVQDEDGDIRHIVLQTLAKQWPDETTRGLLLERAVQDDHTSPRGTALLGLTNTWPDETTRGLLLERAVQDDHAALRGVSLILVGRWIDDVVRAFLADRAVRDEHMYPRQLALEVLAKGWPNEETQTLLKERASIDGFAAAQVGREHSQFGELVFTKGLNGIAPYLDPIQPIVRDHIEQAAKHTDIPPARIDEVVQSLSEHMGWDITKGSTEKGQQ